MNEREVRLESADIVDLEYKWIDACSKLDLRVVFSRKDPVFENLEKVYKARRGYHNLDHISFMLRLLEQYRPKLKEPEIVDLATFFHDVEYTASSDNNEEISARYAIVHLGSLGANPNVFEQVARLILETKNHKVREGASDDLAYFLDSDMVILGSDETSYNRYAVGVARDFRAIDPKAYIAGRSRFLQGLVDERIFSTDAMHMRFQDKAQVNIKHELAELEKIAKAI